MLHRPGCGGLRRDSKPPGPPILIGGGAIAKPQEKISAKGIHQGREGEKSYPRRATKGLEESQEGCAKGWEERKDFQKGAEVSVSETPLFRPIGSVPTSGAGAWFSEKRGHGTRANGSFPKEAGRLSEKSPAGHRRRTIGTTPPGSAGVPPASSPFACRSVSPRFGSRPPCRREPHGPGRSRALAPLPVDPGRGDGRGCARICAGGTPALPGGFIP